MRVRWLKRRSKKPERGRRNLPGPEVVVSMSGITEPQALEGVHFHPEAPEEAGGEGRPGQAGPGGHGPL